VRGKGHGNGNSDVLDVLHVSSSFG